MIDFEHVSLTLNSCRRYTKGIRLAQTTMGTLLCSSLRDSLMADCAVINAGNIRGNMLYDDDKHSVTYADLKSEIPFDSKVTVAGPVSRPFIWQFYSSSTMFFFKRDAFRRGA